MESKALTTPFSFLLYASTSRVRMNKFTDVYPIAQYFTNRDKITALNSVYY